jgi:hypothetical protein
MNKSVKISCDSSNILVIYKTFRFSGKEWIAQRIRYQQGGNMVSLTDKAVGQFKDVVEKQGTAGDGIRIFVVPGG